MKIHQVLWNVLRVLAIFVVGFLLVHANIVQTGNARRETFDLITHQAEMTPDAVQEKLGRIQDADGRVLDLNGYGIPALVFLALLPYARRNKAGIVAPQHDG